MSDLKNFEIRRLDFMLLMVLREGVRQRKLADVAGTLGVTQTAISHSVARLRGIFEDELFIRRPHGVEPTARAIALAGMAEEIIDRAGAMLADPAPFDPATETRTLRIAALDFEVTLVSGIVGTLGCEAPAIRLAFRALARDAAVLALERNEIDLWLGYARDLPPALEGTPLFEETYKVISRRGHPRIGHGTALDIETYCAAHHVVASPGGRTGGIVDRALEAHGRQRTIAVTTTGFLTVLDLVARSDLIATVPARLAKAQSARFGLALSDPPVTPRPFRVSATWHRRARRDQAIEWLVGRLQEGLA